MRNRVDELGYKWLNLPAIEEMHRVDLRFWPYFFLVVALAHIEDLQNRVGELESKVANYE